VKTAVFNTRVQAATNFFTADLTPSYTPCIFRIYITVDTGGVLSIRRTNGGTTVAENLNGGLALSANCAYMWDIVVDQGDTINFQTTVTATVLKLSVDEVSVGTSG
jgi:hypothetical protein